MSEQTSWIWDTDNGDWTWDVAPSNGGSERSAGSKQTGLYGTLYIYQTTTSPVEVLSSCEVTPCWYGQCLWRFEDTSCPTFLGFEMPWMSFNFSELWELRPLSEILEIRKHDVSETGSISVVRWGRENLLELISVFIFKRNSGFGGLICSFGSVAHSHAL
jgi:hypothetical protein